MNTLMWVGLLSSALFLSGCENNAASYVIDNSANHSISFMREQNLAWVGDVQQRFVVSRFPDCQRRFTVDPGRGEMPKIDLFELRPMLYAARQGNTWYALSTEVCQVQKFSSPPETIPPGRLLGSFEKRDGALMFKAQATPAN
jgi:hypothetical protein